MAEEGQEQDEASMNNVAGWLLLLSFSLVVMVTLYIFYLGSVNDFGLSPLNTLIENQVAAGSLPIEAQEISHQSNAILIQWIYHIDTIWIGAYISFTMILLMMAYFAPRINLFSFSNIVYIVTMFFLFILDIIIQVNDWFISNFLLKILPGVTTIIPKFLYFLDHLGIILTATLLLCALLNAVDFDISKFRQRKQKERDSMQEVL